MKRSHHILLALLAVILSCGISACCALLGDCPNGTPSLPTTSLVFETTVSGVLSAWTNVDASGYAVPDEGGSGYTCNPATDSNCITSFGPGTVTSGTYVLSTNALPGDWDIAGAASASCPDGANSGIVFLSVSVPFDIICNAAGSGTAVASPSGCVLTLNNATGAETTTCPATITLTLIKPNLPTAHALTVGYYSDSASEQSSSSATATNTTTIKVPVPTIVGEDILVLSDPTTKQVLGAGVFRYSQDIINPCGTKKSCN
jgi:hypothetical protein